MSPTTSRGSARELPPITRPDGRTLTLCEVGPADAPVGALYLHGTGSSRWEVAPYAVAAEARGLRIVAWNRPRHGGSTPQPGRRMADVVDDARAVIEHVGADRPAAFGLSGGGAHVIALAALAPELIERAVTINAGTPPQPELLAQMPSQMARTIGLASRNPKLFGLLAKLTQSRNPLMRKMAERQLEPEDRACLQDPTHRPVFEAAAAEGAEQPGAWLEEARMLWSAPWTFPVDHFEVPVHAFTGAKDPFRPFALALQRAGATLHEFPGGHMSGFTPEVMEEIVTILSTPTLEVGSPVPD